MLKILQNLAFHEVKAQKVKQNQKEIFKQEDEAIVYVLALMDSGHFLDIH